MLQLGVPLLDSRQHPVERVDQRAHLVIARFLSAHQIVLLFGDDFRRAREVHNRPGNQWLEFVGDQKGDQARDQHDHRHDVGITFKASL